MSDSKVSVKPVPAGKDDTTALRRMAAQPTVSTPGPKARALDEIIGKIETARPLTNADVLKLKAISAALAERSL